MADRYRGANMTANTPSSTTSSTKTGIAGSIMSTNPPADERFSGMTVSVAR